MPVRKRGRGVPNKTYTRKRACTGKDRYPTSEAAYDNVRWRVRTQGASRDAYNVYDCKFGERDGKKHWHVGHLPGNLRKR
jgi:hypothetical protein